MDGSDLIRLILLVVALLLSAFFSASESAFLSIQRGKLALLVQRGAKGADKVAQIAGRPEKLLPTVLTGNNLVNVTAAALGTVLAASFLTPNWAVVASTGGVTILLLLFGETLPKTIAAKRAERLAIAVVRPLQVAEALFFPVVWLLEKFSKIVARLFGVSGATMVTEEEIRSLIAIAQTEGVVESTEAQMLEKVFHFGDRQVREIMTPRPDILWLEKETSVREFLDIYMQQSHTRFPVFEESVDNVIGILSIKDVVMALAKGDLKDDDNVTSLLRPAYFVPETKTVSSLFLELRDTGQQLAMTVDEFGGIAGLATIRKLLEVIVGPVAEEGQPLEEPYETMGENLYHLDADMSVQELEEQLAISLPQGEYQTVAGFILDRLGHIPQEGDHLHYENLTLTVREMRGVKVERVAILRHDREGLEER